MVLLTSMGERLADAGINTLICLSVTFLVLIFISLIISLFKVFPKIEASIMKKKSEKEEEKRIAEQAIDNTISQIEAKEAETVHSAEGEEYVNDLELVAVITAAVAAYTESGNSDGFVVRSIRKVRR